MAGRLRSSVCMAMLKPWPSWPIRLAAGMRTSSRTTSPVGLPCIPSFRSSLAIRSPWARSTTKQDTPRARPAGSVLAKTTYTSEIPALVIQYFVPLRTYESPSRSALAVMAATSLPASASDRQ